MEVAIEKGLSECVSIYIYIYIFPVPGHVCNLCARTQDPQDVFLVGFGAMNSNINTYHYCYYYLVIRLRPTLEFGRGPIYFAERPCTHS